METKICTKCEKELNITRFNFYVKGKRRKVCVTCVIKARSTPNPKTPDLDGEIWLPVVGFEKTHSVSNMGRVKRTLLRGKLCDKIMKKSFNDRGYHTVAVVVNNIQLHPLVHRLVAMAFIPNPENKPDVNHLKGIKTDNRASELEWCTKPENMKHASEFGLLRKGEEVHNSKLSNEQVLEIRELSNIMTRKSLSDIYGVATSTITKIVLRKRYKHI